MTSDSTTSRKTRRAPTGGPAGLLLKKAYEPGEIIAEKYKLEELLGEGGMGAVWRAYNETLEIDVAVKLIRAEEADAFDGPALGDRLLQEARAAARLGHPAIARVFDFGVTDRGDPFIVMELLKGEDLAQALARRGRLSATKAVATIMPIMHALAAAHAKGIVHRDLKPENIFLARGEDGRVQPKLVDFGIAKIERGKNHRLTQTGAMLGSPMYMSPEQARGDDVDHLADVWAVCVVLYEMITGRPPFEGKNYNALLFSIIADDPPPSTSFGSGDDELWAILKRGFNKDPDQRWRTVRELGTELANWMLARNQHEDITGASVSTQWLRRMASNADALASMLPPSSSKEDDAQNIAEVIDRRSPPAAEASTVTVARKPPGLPRLATPKRLLLVALGSALLGAGLVAFALSGSSGPLEPSPAIDEPGARMGSVDLVPVPAAAPPDETESSSEANEGVSTVIPPTSSVVGKATEPQTSKGADEPAAPAPVSKPAPRVRPAAKKTKLKNPFD